ncbi:MAG: zinc metallopeptidase [Proteobacteria bacterium]|nr:zinc metallopeptidase [Pseudomonadota bacterium]
MMLLIPLFLLLIFGPQLWVSYILKKHHKPLGGMPGTGGELAQHLIERFELDGVTLKQGRENEDHYDPENKCVSLSPEVYNGKSLTAVAVAAHEVGHAIQFIRDEPVSHLRKKYLHKAHMIQHYGVYILMSFPVVGLVFRIPHLAILAIVVGLATMLASVLMYGVILPEEYDASFNKAMPILEEGYVPEEYLPMVRQVLKACALTYVAAALADILRLWRWLAIIR